MSSQDTPNRVTFVNSSDLYLNKELSWLEFNARVLDEALTPDTPLLERLKFLAIFSNNLDEFFMVRVAGLKKMEQELLRITDSPDGMETSQVLGQIRNRTLELMDVQYRCLNEHVLPELATHDIKILKVSKLSAPQRKHLDEYFDAAVSPVLTPLGVDPAHPFPFLSNQSLYLVVVPKHIHATEGESGIGFVEIPSILPRLIPVHSETPGAAHFVLLEDLIAANLTSLFFGLEPGACYTIRVTRNLDYNLLENKVVDLLKSIQKEMQNREHQEVVRLEVDARLPEPILNLIKTSLNIAESDVYRIPRPLFIPGLMALHKIPLEHLKDSPFNPRLPPALAGSEDIFSVIAKKDLLVHHPYESFYAVTEFLHSAAHDPNVLAIKQTLYRSAGDSPIIDALIAAAENGKQVTAVIELKARFDEKNNIIWARRLERAGVNVVFGFVGLKTHSKAVLVVRREGHRLVRYVHLSTGNYNSNTAKLYTDVGFFTSDEAIGRDIAMIFNLITGFDVLTGTTRVKETQVANQLTKIALSPVNLKETVIGLIDKEIEHKKKSGTGFIMAKMNSLVDKDIIDALYRASQAGVKVSLIVRGICCLRPGIQGISQNIEVISIIDRFLEHSRIFYFQSGGEHRVYLASADWMPRNMDRRIEIMWPIENLEIKARLTGEILRICWSDNVKARYLTHDGKYLRRKPKQGEETIRSQAKFIEIARAGGIQSMPYEIAIRHNPMSKQGQRPIARKKPKKPGDMTSIEASHHTDQATAPSKGSQDQPAPAPPVTNTIKSD